ncbi:uncharacterized protein LOC106178258 [Lingula anatina]|uniref:Uncharacterized protein LOC106178258 n=1 Tax=Lingula anatina TaxID=7574 RepID=A0A1S3K337_LINAN|nr:uncharacterized protein LOC106178258 [Lingula anatina]|eukprot:XP_013416829.1 uncharacterized protein LOC106178258 [Lingula anatina]
MMRNCVFQSSPVSLSTVLGAFVFLATTGVLGLTKETKDHDLEFIAQLIAKRNADSLYLEKLEGEPNRIRRAPRSVDDDGFPSYFDSRYDVQFPSKFYLERRAKRSAQSTRRRNYVSKRAKVNQIKGSLREKMGAKRAKHSPENNSERELTRLKRIEIVDHKLAKQENDLYNSPNSKAEEDLMRIKRTRRDSEVDRKVRSVEAPLKEDDLIRVKRKGAFDEDSEAKDLLRVKRTEVN